MSVYKYIYWRPEMGTNDKGETFVNVHLLVGYTSCTIASFQGMADTLRETFPQATDDQVECGKVHRSSYANGFSIVAWAGYLPEGEYPDWIQIRDNRIEYSW